MNSIRTCIATRKKYPKEQLLRISIFESNVQLDIKKVFPSRGVYILPSLENLEKAIVSGSIIRVLKINRKLSESEVLNLRYELQKFLNEKEN